MLDIMMCYQRVCRLRPGGTRDASPAAFARSFQNLVQKWQPRSVSPRARTATNKHGQHLRELHAAFALDLRAASPANALLDAATGPTRRRPRSCRDGAAQAAALCTPTPPNEVRFASVEVTSAELLAMCISRRDFESQRFHELVPDAYR